MKWISLRIQKFQHSSCFDIHVGRNIKIFVFALSEVREKKKKVFTCTSTFWSRHGFKIDFVTIVH